MTQKPNTLQIERTDCYRVGDKLFQTLESAKIQALRDVLPLDSKPEIATAIVEHEDAVIEILAWGESARKPKRKPRSDIGKEHRKPTTPPEAPQPVGVKVEGSGKYANK